MSAPTTSHPKAIHSQLGAASAASHVATRDTRTARVNKLGIFAMVLAFAVLLAGGIAYYETHATPYEPCNFGCQGAANALFGASFPGPAQ